MPSELPSSQIDELRSRLKRRFDKNKHRHQNLDWGFIQQILNTKPQFYRILWQMELTEGEPDILFLNPNQPDLYYVDCSKESPKGRRSLCYDQDALESRKEFKPKSSALGMAQEMGVELLTESQYYELQKIEEFDLKTSSWLKTEAKIRILGGAIYGDRRFSRVFIYHNGAESYYAVRGFRAYLKIN